jgi:hypothetical protein
MDIDTSTQQTPLLQCDAKEQAVEVHQNSSLDIQFYEPSAIFGVSKEIASGYLVLLTGGNYKCDGSMAEDNHSKPTDQTDTSETLVLGINESRDDSQSAGKLPDIDEQTAALAYAAITDGNVLHTCFGLKSGPNGRPTSNIIGEKQSVSIFCCFPSASGPTLQNIRISKSKKDMGKLVEILRDAKESEAEIKGVISRVDAQVIEAYVRCFAAIVKYNDAFTSLQSKGDDDDSKAKKAKVFCSCPNLFATLSSILFCSKKSELNLKVSELQKSTMAEINGAFADLKIYLAEIQTGDVVSVAETGVTVEECKDDV